MKKKIKIFREGKEHKLKIVDEEGLENLDKKMKDLALLGGGAILMASAVNVINS